MSERLEEIKKTVYKMHGEELEHNPNDEIAHIWYKDMKWLIQQAERVKDLEEHNQEVITNCKKWYDLSFKFNGEKERYKQALIEISNVQNSYKDHDEMWTIAYRALKGE